MEVKKHEKNCDIIRDLIRMYVDNLTSDETNQFIKDHINSCKDCREYLENVKRELPNNDSESLEGDMDKNDHKLIKGIKHRIYKMMFIALLIGVLIGAMVFFNIALVFTVLCILTLIYLIKTGKEVNLEKRGITIAIFVFSFISLIISLKLFLNIAIYVDDYAIRPYASPQAVYGGDFWLYMAWLRIGLLAIITFISGIKLFSK